MLSDLLSLDAKGGLMIAVLIGVANFLTILAVMRALAPRDLVAARARSHAKRRKELRHARLAPPRLGRRSGLSLARAVVARLRLDRGKDAEQAGNLLVQAGWRSKDAATFFLSLRVAGPLLVGALVHVTLPIVRPDLTGNPRLLVTVAAMLGGAYLPTLLLKNAVTRRRLAIQRSLPDALDLFVICAEAGLSLDATVTRVARELGAGAPQLSDELGLTAIELGFLPDRREALQNLTRRVSTPDMRGLVNTLAQTERYGTPLAQALRVLAAEFRDTRMMRAEEKAARLPATLTVPLILFILPPLFVVLLGPAIIQVMHVMK